MSQELSYNQPTSRLPRHNIFYNKHTQLLGHRGARGEIAENSKEGFEYINKISMTFNDTLVGIEFDVQLTKDNVLVVFHDDDLLRLYGRQSRIDQLTYLEIKQLTEGRDTAPIMRLEDIKPLLLGYKHIELEIKTNERTDHHRLIQALTDSLEPLIDLRSIMTLTSFDLRFHYLAKSHALLSIFKRGLLVEPYGETRKSYENSRKFLNNIFEDDCGVKKAHAKKLDHAFDTSPPFNTNVREAKNLYDIPSIALKLGCSRIGLFHLMYDQKFIDICKRFNLDTSAWTVNEIVDATRLIELGIDHIITDYPLILLNAHSY